LWHNINTFSASVHARFGARCITGVAASPPVDAILRMHARKRFSIGG
jgi:hypothetical protein